VKTPPELLLERHRVAQSKLDAIRRETLARMEKFQLERSPISLREIFHSLRWHLAGMGAVWIFVLILQLDTGRPSQMMASIPPAKIPTPQITMASLRENRRQLAEMIDSRPPENQSRELFLPKPRSERCPDIFNA
jgi:hypothetical protein